MRRSRARGGFPFLFSGSLISSSERGTERASVGTSFWVIVINCPLLKKSVVVICFAASQKKCGGGVGGVKRRGGGRGGVERRDDCVVRNTSVR